jgi:hypothetical protein
MDESSLPINCPDELQADHHDGGNEYRARLLQSDGCELYDSVVSGLGTDGWIMLNMYLIHRKSLIIMLRKGTHEHGA